MSSGWRIESGAWKLRIAVWHNLPSGGGKRALHDHVRGLVDRGHHVECWSPPTADLSYMPLAAYAAEHVVPVDRHPTGGRGRIGRWMRPYRDVVADVEAMIGHARRCVSEIESGDFDLIFGNSCGHFATPFLARFTALPTVLYLQEPNRVLYEAALSQGKKQLEWVARPSRPDRRGRVRWWRQAGRSMNEIFYVNSIRLRAREEAANAHAFGRLLCNSRFSREAMIRTYGRDAEVCYLGINTDAFPMSARRKESYAVGLGSFGPHKGIELAIEAVATIDPSRRPHLVWVGNSAERGYYQRLIDLAARLGVTFVPRELVSQNDLIDILGRAAVMIYPSRLEPFGYAPLEANACGTAVVGIAEGGIRETIEDGVNGLLIEGADPVAIGRAVSRYADDPDFAREEGAKAREHVVKSWQVEFAVDRLEMHLAESLRVGRPASAPQPA